MDHIDRELLQYLHSRNECDPRTCMECRRKRSEQRQIKAERITTVTTTLDNTIDVPPSYLGAYTTAGWYDPNGKDL